MNSLTSNETIQRAIEEARFFVPENKWAEKMPNVASGLARENARQAALREAERHRLVKAAKCPTDDFEAKKRFYDNAKLMDLIRPNLAMPESEKFGRVGSIETETQFPDYIEIDGSKYNLADYATNGELVPYNERQPVTGSGRWAVISHREWSGEYRIRTQVEQPHAAPPEQSGQRVTAKLSDRGALALADSCHYMAVKHGGYSTFLTLTFDDEARARIAAEESTIQKEASRFFDGIQKMYQRGWEAKTDLGKVRMPSSKYMARTNEKMEIKRVREPLKYCWVAENPKNEAGEDNPHLHVLMSWRVPFEVFQSWAAKIESLWGQGFAHLEKIKDPMQAGAYMAKAAGYLTKANGESDQGEIRGNRYGISAEARAPEWECITRAEMGSMGYLIKDIHDYFGAKYGQVFKERRQLNDRLDEVKAEHTATKAQGGKVTRSQAAEREKIGKRLSEVRKVANELPAVAGKYQLLIKGKDRFNAFMLWATKGARNAEFDWLPDISKSFVWDASYKPNSLWYERLRTVRKGFIRGKYLDQSLQIYTQTVAAVRDYLSMDTWNEYASMGVAVND